MKTSFETTIEKLVPEINFLTATGAGVKPGSVLESLEKDIVVGNIIQYIKDLPSLSDISLDTIEEPYDLRLVETNGSDSNEAALKLMDLLGIKYNSGRKYRINFKLEEITSIRFKELNKINVEIALKELKKDTKDIFKRFKNHILVFRTLYAKKYEVSIEVEKEG